MKTNIFKSNATERVECERFPNQMPSGNRIGNRRFIRMPSKQFETQEFEREKFTIVVAKYLYGSGKRI
jgi:hypothetical protein